MEMCGQASEDFDPFHFHRQSINDGGGHFPKVLDVLVDAGRDIVRHLIETDDGRAAALIDGWFGSKIPILRRLAIYGLTYRYDVPADEKLQWLIRNELLYRFKTDVFSFLKENYPKASDVVKREILEIAMLGPT